MKNLKPMFDVEDWVLPHFKTLQPYTSARDEYTGKTGVFMDANENPFPSSTNRYPDPYQSALKQTLSQIKGVSTDQIFLGNGSDEIIDLAYRLFCESGKDRALTCTPTYGMYEVSAQIQRIELVKVPLTADFQLDRKGLEVHLADEKLKLIFLCSPNNPTGNLLKTADILWLLEQFKGILVLDEAYIDFAEAPSWIDQIETYPNLLILQTLSKAWGLAGVRLGCAFANSKILHFFNKVKPPYNISSLNQEAALERLQQQAAYKRERTIVLAQKAYLAEALRKMPIVKKVFPSDTNFLLVEVSDAKAMYDFLVAQKIVVRNRASQIPQCLRISVGTASENEALLMAMQQFDNQN